MGVNAVNVPKQDDALTTILKGLQIADGVYGIRTKMDQLEKYQRDKEHEEDLSQGIVRQDEQTALRKDYDFYDTKPKNQNTQELFDNLSGTAFYVARKNSEKSPVFNSVANMKQGKEIGTGFFDPNDISKGVNAPKIFVPTKEPKDPNADSKLTKDNFDAAMFGRNMQTANAVFDELKTSGYNRGSYKEWSNALLPESTYNPILKRQAQAERNFLNAWLRRVSGAAISQSEFDNGEQQFFERLGDTPEVVAQKRQNREQVFLGMKAAAQGAWDKVPSAPLRSYQNFEKDVMDYAKKHGITPEKAQMIKDLRTGGGQ